jgi:hypothetical protein
MKQDQQLYDRLRQEDIEAQGYRVVRVTTEEVKKAIGGTLRKILRECQSSPPAPLPRERGVPTQSGRGEAEGVHDRNP